MLIDLSLLFRNRNYGLLYTGQTVSFAGTMMTSVALPWQIYHLTQSVVMIGLLSLCQLIPLLFTALLGGVMADRYPRRKLLLMAETVLSIACLSLVWNAGRPHPSIPLIFFSAMIMSSLNGLHRPALESLTQQIVKPADFITAGALTGLKFSVCAILAPAVGGWIIAEAGLNWAYIVDFLTFFVSLMAIWMMQGIPVLENPPTKSLSVWTSLNQAVQYAFKRQVLMGSYMVDFIAMIFGMPNALFPVIAHSYGGLSGPHCKDSFHPSLS